MKTLIVAPWGDPVRWKEIRYIVELPSKNFKDIALSKEYYCKASSLAALHEAFEKELGWKCFSLILIPSTLAVNGPDFYENIPEKFSNLAKIALNYVKSIAQNKPILPKNNYCLRVIPSIGLFPSKDKDFETLFRGSIRIFYSAVYFTVLKTLSEDKYDVVVLDLSHGVNFMPVTTRNAIEYAAYAYTASGNVEKLQMLSYNSAPITPPPGKKAEEIPPLNIHLIESIKIDPEYAFQQLYNEVYSIIKYRGQSFETNKLVNIVDKERAKILIRKYLNFIEKELLLNQLNELNKLATDLTDSLQNGLILKLAMTLDKLGYKHLSAIEKVIEEYSIKCKALTVNKHYNKKTQVEYNYNIEPRIRVTKLHALIYAILKRTEKIGKISEDTWYPIDILNKIEEEFIVDKVKKIIIKNELENYKTRILGLKDIIGEKPLAKEEGIPYAAVHSLTSEARAIRLIDLFRRYDPLIRRIVKDLEDIASKTSLEYDERNFYAHAGLEQNIVKIKVKGNKILVKYRKEI